MSKIDPQVVAHLEWLGFVQPTGLVVSAPALVRAGAILDQRDIDGQRLLRSCVLPGPGRPRIADFRAFATTVLGWRFSPRAYAGTAQSPIPTELAIALDDSTELLTPNLAVRELEPQSGASSWQLLVQTLAPNVSFDSTDGDRLALSPHSRLERLLRKTGVTAGLLVNGATLRLVSAARGESSGWLDFHVGDMLQTSGRPILAAMRLLLSEHRLLALPRHQRLAGLLAESRKFQSEVSEKLAEQVLHAMYELLRGFQTAHDSSKGELLREALAEEPDDVYRALLTVILRLVFLLYAQERDMLPEPETFVRYYSVAGLHERLREDAALYPDTMDQRYGAWAQLVSLFRMVHDGAKAVGMNLPARHGALFDPDRFKFLEGRRGSGGRQRHERLEYPLVPDGSIYRALENLLVLDGERISYRALDVEQIGSVYETMMGFRLETATGRSVAIKSQRKRGAPTAVDLDALLSVTGVNRSKLIQEQAERKLPDGVKKNLVSAATLEELHAALLPVIDQAATPDLVPRGAMVLQPSEERRRSGSHYTPRELTEPIVRMTLDPILARLPRAVGKIAYPDSILSLKVCDPAMGSGAFLVEACRYLGDALIESWHTYNTKPTIPADEDDVIFARRLVVQRCLYGVDRNPVAVDLAKMSLWLVTLAKDHALTFVDHALRHGDSLLGLSRRQLEAFHWDESHPPFLHGLGIRDSLDKVADFRQQIREADENVPDRRRRDLWNEVQYGLGKVRLIGDLVVAAYLQAAKSKDREAKRLAYVEAVANGTADQYSPWLRELREADPPLVPFHWDIEFPEVFDRAKPGFDAFVGNPPFAGVVSFARSNVPGYTEWLREIHKGSEGKCDLVAHFFRRSFALLREGGTAGLIATKTIAQGDTRASGLYWICMNGGRIIAARRRVAWPGMAAVVVSIVHMSKGEINDTAVLDGEPVDRISAFLVRGSTDTTPPVLHLEARPIAGYGNKPNGSGFIFAANPKERQSNLSVKDEILAEHPDYRSVLRPFLGGSDLNAMVGQVPFRWIIDFGDRSLEEVRAFPELLRLVSENVRPFVTRLNWWQFEHRAHELKKAISDARIEEVLVVADASDSLAFTFVPSAWTLSNSIVGFATDSRAAFAILQSRVHELWVRALSLSLKDDIRYVPGSCYDTFPWSINWTDAPDLIEAARHYLDFRESLILRNGEGLTKIYNRFHDPDQQDRDVVMLRELHAAMDRAVLDSYKWTDIDTHCEFRLGFEIDEDEWADKKKPWRLRWPENVRDEVLARLLRLNADRARAEVHSGIAVTSRRRSAAVLNDGNEDLLV